MAANPSLYVSPTGSGDLNGSSAANAATLFTLNKLISQAGPGGEVLLLADQGAYTLSADLQLYSGGATIRGVNAAGEPMQATIAAQTASIFVLRDGADGLTFKDLVLRDTIGSLGALRVAGDVRDLTLENVDATNVRTFFAVGPSPGETASVDGLVVRNVEVTGYTSAAIKLAGDSRDILLEDIVLDGQNKDPSSFMVGVQMSDTAHDIVIRRVTASNNIYTGSIYWNGDGFVAEEGVYNLTIQDTVARNNGDAGYDIKASNTLIENAVAEGSKRNFRFWADGITADHITGLNPHQSGGSGSQNQVWLGENARAAISNSTFADGDADTIVFELDVGAALTLVNTKVTKAAGATLQALGENAAINTVTSHATSGLIGGESADHLQGQTANEELRGEGGDDYVRGGEGDDVIYGGAGFDDVHGNTGNDTVDGGLGPDWVVGGRGDDLLFGQGDADVVIGNLGADTCSGGEGEDTVRGGQDNDMVQGEGGNDWLSGDRGDDTLTGGAGADIFHSFGDAGVDRVTDFNRLEGDRVLLDPGTTYSVSQWGPDLLIEMTGGGRMVLLGVSLANLAGDWIAVG